MQTTPPGTVISAINAQLIAYTLQHVKVLIAKPLLIVLLRTLRDHD